ncbi:hypothetical protein DAEQUDRAFT_737722 [Daedalea quercina L-15889]|uniref:Uncharacterized protein n=1 Tax=Daedalea quercina L-15889 TaxID=1314783 RepID=A0A165QVA6_9APHY|nr:hypothetical protein DAEQUDRAFT_737722 [Daedalea quercina L-15889]
MPGQEPWRAPWPKYVLVSSKRCISSASRLHKLYVISIRILRPSTLHATDEEVFFLNGIGPWIPPQSLAQDSSPSTYMIQNTLNSHARHQQSRHLRAHTRHTECRVQLPTIFQFTRIGPNSRSDAGCVFGKHIFLWGNSATSGHRRSSPRNSPAGHLARANIRRAGISGAGINRGLRTERQLARP